MADRREFRAREIANILVACASLRKDLPWVAEDLAAALAKRFGGSRLFFFFSVWKEEEEEEEGGDGGWGRWYTKWGVVISKLLRYSSGGCPKRLAT